MSCGTHRLQGGKAFNCDVQSVTKFMTPAFIRNTWKQVSRLLWPTVLMNGPSPFLPPLKGNILTGKAPGRSPREIISTTGVSQGSSS